MIRMEKNKNENIIIGLTVLTIFIYVVAVIKRLFLSDISTSTEIIINNFSRFIVLVAIFPNWYFYFKNKEYFKYKEMNTFFRQLWLLVCNVSRLLITYAFVILITSTVFNLLALERLSDVFNDAIATTFALILFAQFIKFVTEGKLTFFRFLLFVGIVYLASISDIMEFVIGSFGVKLILDIMFSDDYIEYVKLTNSFKDEKLEKIKEKFNDIKYKWKSNLIYFIFSLNLVVVIKKNIPENIKKNIFCFLREHIYREVANVENTEISDRIIIGGVIIIAAVIVFAILKGLIYENVTKRILEIEGEVIDMSKEQTKQVLNQLVADLSQQSVIVHQAHWYMRGATFITMHPLMDQHMELLDAQLDEVSERLITLGGAPYSTLREFADNTKIADAKGNYSDSMEDRIRHLLVGYRYLIDLYQKGIDVTGEEGDDVTQDIFIGAKGALEKLVWMLTATINEAPGL